MDSSVTGKYLESEIRNSFKKECFIVLTEDWPILTSSPGQRRLQISTGQMHSEMNIVSSPSDIKSSNKMEDQAVCG